ncbi:hypothetical protein [Parasphingorhabdus sp.]|uniref:hypothetical protein n=1 Tax=Parasphingorhabdus sp. TaxID=2709688 RepID=UPI003C750714
MVKLNYMQCWNGAMALLGAHKEAILAIAGVFLFLPTFLFAQFVAQPILTGDEDLNGLLAVYTPYLNENALAIMASNFVISFGGLAIYLTLAPSRNTTVADDLITALKAFLIYLIANLLTGLLVLPGLFLFVLPGAYIWARLVLAPVVIADRGERNPVGAIKKSWSLTQNNGFSILLFILIIAVTGTITIGAVQAVVGIIVGLATGGAGWPFIENLVASLTGTAFQLVLAVIIMSVYLELTGKKRDVTEVFN